MSFILCYFFLVITGAEAHTLCEVSVNHFKTPSYSGVLKGHVQPKVDLFVTPPPTLLRPQDNVFGLARYSLTRKVVANGVFKTCFKV